jgi:site-specific recombinase, phage integrase family
MDYQVSRVLIISGWKVDPVKKGNVLVKFAMRFTHPITKQSRKKSLSSGVNKGWFTTKASPSGLDSKGNPRLLVTDIKNPQLLTQVTQKLNKIVDTYIDEILGVQPVEAKRILTLDEVARPFDESGELYGKAFVAWFKKKRPATNTLKTRISVFNNYLKPHFDMQMSIAQFSLQAEKIQELINAASLSMGKLLYLYVKMIFDWSLENHQIEPFQHPILNKRIEKRSLTRSEEQALKRMDIAEKYLEVEEAKFIFNLIESWTNRSDYQLVVDVLKTIYLTGMRPSEVLGLNEDVLDFENKLIKVHWQRAAKNKTEDEMRRFNLAEKEKYRSDLKTVESVRVIPMVPEVEKILLRYVERNKFQARFNENYQNLGYLFTRTYMKKGNKQGSPLYHTEISSFLRGGSSQSAKYNKKAGRSYKDIDDYLDFGRPIHVVPHMFRHSFVSVLASEKIPLEAIRSLVGHSDDSREIEKVYLHVMGKSKNSMRVAMDNLSEQVSDEFQSVKNQSKHLKSK